MRILSILLSGALALSASVAFGWPNAPDEDPQLAPPNDPGYAGQWNLWSAFPESWLPNIEHEVERQMGPGIHADRAWQVTTGDRRVLIAVHDSGAYWENPDLVNKYYLNRGELANCMPEPGPGDDPFDSNGDGVFNVLDYYVGGTREEKLEQWDANNNGLIDPEDLIILCSDGEDDDGNGYIDDISGWDFFDDDNNAADDTRFGHGNGEARDAAAEGNNGIGGIGVCPECTVLMVRVGDAFVTDSNHFAQGVVFSVDTGASLIQSALGTVNYTRFARAAIDYAYNNNVAVVASAADELSYHHNFPGSGEHSIYVHAIQYDAASAARSTTFLNFNNCTNYGMQLLLSTPGTGCSSEAAGITSGHVGLMYSAALQYDLQPPLSAEEVKQLLTMTADDIAINPNDDDPEKYPSRIGWDWHFGYGRNNARATVDAIVDGNIPPEVYIDSPSWFQVIDPDRTPSIDIHCHLNVRADGASPRFDKLDWVLEYATGVAPADSEFIEISSGETTGQTGLCGTWDTTSVDLDLDRRVDDPHQNAVTLRLRATGTNANGVTLRGEHRKAAILHKDPTSHDAFPMDLGTSLESSPIYADIDGDGKEELVLFASDGYVHAFKEDGTEAAGFPAAVDLRDAMKTDTHFSVRNSCAFRENKEGCLAQNGWIDPEIVRQTAMMPASIGDLDGDGTLEIVVATWDGWVFVFNNDGTMREGWPQEIDRSKRGQPNPNAAVESGFFASPVLYDLDQKPGLEIIVAGMDQHIYVWHADGTPMAPYPVRLYNPNDPDSVAQRARIVSTPAVGDIDGDGKPDIASGTSEVYGGSGNENEAVAYVIDGQTGQVKDGWPQSLYGLTVNVLPIVGRGVVANPMLADLDYDGKLEISFDTISTPGIIFRHDGSIYRTMNNNLFGPNSDSTDGPAYILMNQGAFGNIDGEGGIDMVKGTAGFNFAIAFAGGGKRAEFDHHMSGWDTDTGMMMNAFPRKHDDWQFFNSPSIVDIDNDNLPEVIVGSGGYLLRAWNHKGEQPEGFPKQTGGWIIAAPAIGDMDGDGLFDIATSTRDGWLFAFRTQGKRTNMFEWNGFGHDPMKTGNYENDPIPFAPWKNGQTDPGPVDENVTEEDLITENQVTEEPNGAEIDEEVVESGGCQTGAGNSLWMLLLVASAFTRRRRTR